MVTWLPLWPVKIYPGDNYRSYHSLWLDISSVYLTGHVVIMTSQNAFADVKNVISIVSVYVNSALVETLNQMPEIGGSENFN